MTSQLDARSHTSKHDQHEGVLGIALTESEDFAMGLFHGSIENPYNGISQVVNHATGAHLPELHIVDEKRVNSSIGGKLGTIGGTALDFVAISAVTGGLGGGVLASAATGAAFTGLLQPTDANSKHFWRDRLVNGAIGGATFGAMGAARIGLDATGMFAVPAARSLVGSIEYGALAGAFGGTVRAEADAVLNKHKLLPSAKELISDVGSFAAFGAAYGGLGYALNELTAPQPQQISTERGPISITLDNNGDPVKVDSNLLAQGDYGNRVHMVGSKMTNGQWSTSEVSDDGGDILRSHITGVTKGSDGSFVITAQDADGHQVVRNLGSDGSYHRTDLTQNAIDEQDRVQHELKYGKTVNDASGERHYDTQGRLETMYAKDAQQLNVANAYIDYAKDGSINHASMYSRNEPEVSFVQDKTGGSDYLIQMNHQTYKWNGDIKLLSATVPGGTEHLQFTAKDGSQTLFGLDTGTKGVAEMAEHTATFVPGVNGPVVRVDNDGHVQLTNSKNQTWLVNGEKVAQGKTVQVEPSDTVSLYLDEGDRYPVWSTYILPWNKSADGAKTLGGMQLNPGTARDVYFWDRSLLKAKIEGGDSK